MQIKTAIRKLEHARKYLYGASIPGRTDISDFFGCSGPDAQARAQACQTLSDCINALYDESWPDEQIWLRDGSNYTTEKLAGA